MNSTAGGQALYLLTGTLGAFACYEGVRSALAFRSARSARDVELANLRALAAVAFASLGSGETLRYVGIVLFAVLAFAYTRFVFSERHPPGDLQPAPPSSFESQPTADQL